jgi:DNA-binding MarR family transcriptional regulator
MPGNNLLSLLSEVARLARIEADRRARVHGMTVAQWGLMRRLAKTPGLSQKELAVQLEVEPVSVARMVDRLEANGLLERRPDAADRRVWRLHLLPAAEPVIQKMSALGEGLNRFVTQNIAPATGAAMAEGLQQMKSNLLNRMQAEDMASTATEAAALEESA